jgi:hypothetical protein
VLFACSVYRADHKLPYSSLCVCGTDVDVRKERASAKARRAGGGVHSFQIGCLVRSHCVSHD